MASLLKYCLICSLYPYAPKFNMGKKKLFNDPIYGLVDFRDEVVYELIDQPYFQRLRRIRQMGLSDYVYAGATHPRFQHALGATHLLYRGLDTLESKGVVITDEERQAAAMAILYHDIGHGPFSHALEGSLVGKHHEALTLAFLKRVESDYGSIGTMAIQIFEGRYEKKFLSSLIASQLDVDRLDYLSRDSYYTGVAEGVVGYDRIIKMLEVKDNELLIEEKGLHSIEKFLVSRYLMYAQVYLHKTSLVAEKMLKKAVDRVKMLLAAGEKVEMNMSLETLLTSGAGSITEFDIMELFSSLDDIDVWDLLKRNVNHKDRVLAYLCKGLVNRQLSRIIIGGPEVLASEPYRKAQKEVEKMALTGEEKGYLLINGQETITAYSEAKSAIRFLLRDGQVLPFSQQTALSEALFVDKALQYFIYPRW